MPRCLQVVSLYLSIYEFLFAHVYCILVHVYVCVSSCVCGFGGGGGSICTLQNKMMFLVVFCIEGSVEDCNLWLPLSPPPPLDPQVMLHEKTLNLQRQPSQSKLDKTTRLKLQNCQSSNSPRYSLYACLFISHNPC